MHAKRSLVGRQSVDQGAAPAVRGHEPFVAQQPHRLPHGDPGHRELLHQLLVGESKLLNLKLGEVLVRMRVAHTEAIPETETIPIAFEPSAIHLFDAETGRRVETDSNMVD